MGMFECRCMGRLEGRSMGRLGMRCMGAGLNADACRQHEARLGIHDADGMVAVDYWVMLCVCNLTKACKAGGGHNLLAIVAMSP